MWERFTCAYLLVQIQGRAVHLELIGDLTEENFILAFRRFSSRRSLPKITISDNGTTFVAASKEIEWLSKSVTLKEQLGHLGTIWKFIPWYGGWWERLIGMTKTCLKKTLARALVNLLDEDPITPSHLLHGRKLSSLPYPISNTEDIQTSTTTHVYANKLYRVQVQVLEHFWSRWKREYLTSLREYQRISGNNDQKLKVGDVVLVYNDSPRNKWPLAIKEKLAVGGDGLVSSATIRTKNGTTTRPIGKLYPLEINVEDDVAQNNARAGPTTRAAKTAAVQKIKNSTKS
ncbi:uncharacterized protein [Argopecten irradians]|uniref:uncharacterized protein n=1 Tax=Argopecten irradians TaxID=31199 RepID=UPI003716DA2E